MYTWHKCQFFFIFFYFDDMFHIRGSACFPGTLYQVSDTGWLWKWRCAETQSILLGTYLYEQYLRHFLQHCFVVEMFNSCFLWSGRWVGAASSHSVSELHSMYVAVLYIFDCLIEALVSQLPHTLAHSSLMDLWMQEIAFRSAAMFQRVTHHYALSGIFMDVICLLMPLAFVLPCLVTRLTYWRSILWGLAMEGPILVLQVTLLVLPTSQQN